MKRAHIIPMTSGDEFDALTRWRHFLHWKPGTRKAIKRGLLRKEMLFNCPPIVPCEEAAA
jgi:hypothetical protein